LQRQRLLSCSACSVLASGFTLIWTLRFGGFLISLLFTAFWLFQHFWLFCHFGGELCIAGSALIWLANGKKWHVLFYFSPILNNGNKFGQFIEA
jgi:hypothetical protein